MTKTHKKIAGMIFDCLPIEDQNLFSRTDFIEGSVMPDSAFYYMHIIHRYTNSIHHVEKVIEDIFYRPQSKGEIGKKLGIVIHFLCDYAVAYHSNPKFMNRMWYHIFYERKIEFESIHISPKIESPVIHSLTTLSEELKNYIQIYHSGKHAHPINDFMHGLSISKSFVTLAIKKYKELYRVNQESKELIRVALFSDTYYPHVNGVSNTLYEYMRYLEKNHIEYKLYSPKYNDSMPDKELNFQITKIKSIRFPLYRGAMISLPKYRRLSKEVDLFRPTVIHTLTEFSIGQFAKRYGRSRKIPVITNYSTHFSDSSHGYNLGAFKKQIQKYLMNFHQNVALTTTPSEMAKAYLLDQGVKKVKVFGRGISTTQFNPMYRSETLRTSWTASHKIVLLYVGRVSKEKDLDILFDAYDLLPKSILEQVRLVITGDGPLLEYYQNKYENVIFTGQKTSYALSQIYASADIFVFPSTTETLGNVVLEAMASGLPVIAADIGGVKQNIIPKWNGLLTEPRNSIDFQKAMIRLIQDPNYVSSLKENALNYVKTKDWKRVFNQLMNTYEDTIREQFSSLLLPPQAKIEPRLYPERIIPQETQIQH